MSNPTGGNAANFLNLNLGVGVGGLQGNFLGTGRGDAPPVVALAHILRRVRGREESVGRQERMPRQSDAGRTHWGRGCRGTGGGAAAAACARAGKNVRPATEMSKPHAAYAGMPAATMGGSQQLAVGLGLGRGAGASLLPTTSLGPGLSGTDAAGSMKKTLNKPTPKAY
jgi:hypothetical protein